MGAEPKWIAHKQIITYFPEHKTNESSFHATNSNESSVQACEGCAQRVIIPQRITVPRSPTRDNWGCLPSHHSMPIIIMIILKQPKEHAQIYAHLNAPSHHSPLAYASQLGLFTESTFPARLRESTGAELMYDTTWE